MEKAERENVYKVYDKIAGWFSENRNQFIGERAYLDDVLDLLAAGATVLDLGCGAGKPILEYLITKKLEVTGVDASRQMLEMARANFPSAEFILQDMRMLHLKKKFDAIIAWHSFFHLPLSDQPAMFQVFEDHVNPNGILLFTSGTEQGEVWAVNGGENLFHASLDNAEYERLLHKYHFQVLKHTVNDPDCGGANVWMAKWSCAGQ